MFMPPACLRARGGRVSPGWESGLIPGINPEADPPVSAPHTGADYEGETSPSIPVPDRRFNATPVWFGGTAVRVQMVLLWAVSVAAACGCGLCRAMDEHVNEPVPGVDRPWDWPTGFQRRHG